jgi:hypothetical protein
MRALDFIENGSFSKEDGGVVISISASYFGGGVS